MWEDVLCSRAVASIQYFCKVFPISAGAEPNPLHFIEHRLRLKVLLLGCQGRPTKDEDLLQCVCLRYDGRLCSPISMKATVVHGAALSSSHFIWPPLRQVNRLYSLDGHILVGGDSGRVRFIFIYLISSLIFFSPHQPFGLRRPVPPPRFLHALTPFDKLAPFEGYGRFSSARITTGFSLHLHFCELKGDFCPVFGLFSSLLFFGC